MTLGGWTSDRTAREYIDESVFHKRKMANTITTAVKEFPGIYSFSQITLRVSIIVISSFLLVLHESDTGDAVTHTHTDGALKDVVFFNFSSPKEVTLDGYCSFVHQRYCCSVYQQFDRFASSCTNCIVLNGHLNRLKLLADLSNAGNANTTEYIVDVQSQHVMSDSAGVGRSGNFQLSNLKDCPINYYQKS